VTDINRNALNGVNFQPLSGHTLCTSWSSIHHIVWSMKFVI